MRGGSGDGWNVNQLDAVVLVLMLVAGFSGSKAGLVAMAQVGLGALGGLIVAMTLVDPVVGWLAPERQEAIGIGIAMAGFGAIMGAAVGVFAGAIADLNLSPAHARYDRVGGIVAGVMAVATAMWIAEPALSRSEGWMAAQADGSLVMAAIDSISPASPDLVDVISILAVPEASSDIVGVAVTPRMQAPPAVTGFSSWVERSVQVATVRLTGTACGNRQIGSGIALDDGIVATNAHVVAGVQSGTQWVEQGGVQVRATLVFWDPRSDLAVLRAPGIVDGGLVPGEAEMGAVVAVGGYVRGEALEVLPGWLGETMLASGRDIYGDAPMKREILAVSAAVEQGVSGGPLVDGDGELVGMMFARAVESHVGYAIPSREVLEAVRVAGSSEASSGACLDLHD